ncbi:TPA: hypothetical protein I7682_17865 [Vibrio vulnificus]|nr:hypothetical protein [Vibrio vulnificus]
MENAIYEKFIYKLMKLQKGGSAKFGNCEVCGRPFVDGYLLLPQRIIQDPSTGEESATYRGCNAPYGHKACLSSLTV